MPRRPYGPQAKLRHMDAHYTPEGLAVTLVDAVSDSRPSVIADLCAGHGNLLIQAEDRWPEAQYVALDIDPLAVRHLRASKPTWHVDQCDLRDSCCRSRSSVLKRFSGRISLLLLNPPFSCRGNTRFRVDIPSRPLYASTAISFLLIALKYLHPRGSAAAFLPLGALYSEKDADAWTFLKKSYRVDFLTAPGPDSFPASTASTALVRLSPNNESTTDLVQDKRPVSRSNDHVTVHLIRGCQSIHRTRALSSGPVLVHSSDLRNAAVHVNGRRGFDSPRRVTGPSVMIPRVGQLKKEKIAIFPPSQHHVVLSDCVIAITASSLADAKTVRKILIDGFPTLKAQYVGTGAPFVTMGRLRRTLSVLGIDPDG